MVIRVADGVGKGEVGEGGRGVREVGSGLDCAVLEGCGGDAAKRMALPGTRSGPIRRSTKGGWTEEEDALLAHAVKLNSGKNWKKIAQLFPGKKDVQCLHRWQKVLNPDLVKGTWTKEEDDLIIKLVERHGHKKWSLIAQSLPGRIGKQCRERWHNHLNPAIKREAWTMEEEVILIHAHEMYGNKWAEIAMLLPGRADNAIKNHWNCSVKKKLDMRASSGFLVQTPESRISFPLTKGNSKVDVGRKSASGTFLSATTRDFGDFPREGVSHGSEYLEGHGLKKPVLTEQGDRLVADLHKGIKCSEIDTSLIIQGGKPSEGRVTEGNHLDLVYERHDYVSSCSNNCSRIPESQNCGSRNDASFPHEANHFHSMQFNNDLKILLVTESAGLAFLSESADDAESYNHDTLVPRSSVSGTHNELHCPVLQRSSSDGSSWNDSSRPENYCKQISSLFNCSTPPTLSLGILADCNSPQSILRRRAIDFKYTPSIVRKRRHHCVYSESSHKTLTGYSNLPEYIDTTLKLGPSCHLKRNHRAAGSDISEALNVGKLAISSCDSSKTRFAPAIKSLEKRLEYEFDMEWTPTDHDNNSVQTNNLHGSTGMFFNMDSIYTSRDLMEDNLSPCKKLLHGQFM